MERPKMSRADLLDLTPAALAALSNVGFVKRAQKDLATGQHPLISEQDDGGIEAVFADGSRVSFPVGKSLSDARCSCPASGMCRHRIMLVMAYQALKQNVEPVGSPPESDWSPACFDEAVVQLPKPLLARARRLMAEGKVVRLYKTGPGDALASARLPECDVRFFSRHSLLHARCDCIAASPCEHIVLAVWGFVQAECQEPGFQQLTLTLKSDDAGAMASCSPFAQPKASALLHAVDSLLLKLWLEGSSQPQGQLQSLLATAIHYAELLQWCWVLESLSEIVQLLEALHHRSSRYHPLQLLHAVNELSARLVAARYMDSLDCPQLPASEILGIGKSGDTQLKHLRLLSLGGRYWSDDTTEGVSLIFVDPAQQVLMVMEQQWPVVDVSGNTLARRRIAGYPVRELAAGQLITDAGKRRENGAFVLGGHRRNSSLLPLSAAAWQLLGEPLRQPDANSLIRHLDQLAPDFVRPKQLIERFHILPVTSVLEWSWNASLQRLQIVIQSGSRQEQGDNLVTVMQRFERGSPCAVDIVATALLSPQSEVTEIAGIVYMEAGALFIEPLALMGRERVWLPYLDEIAPFPLDRSAESRDGYNSILGDTERLLTTWLQQGGRHQGGRGLSELQTLIRALQERGLSHIAERLTQAYLLLQANEQRELPKQLMVVYQLLRALKGQQSLNCITI